MFSVLCISTTSLPVYHLRAGWVKYCRGKKLSRLEPGKLCRLVVMHETVSLMMSPAEIAMTIRVIE